MNSRFGFPTDLPQSLHDHKGIFEPQPSTGDLGLCRARDTAEMPKEPSKIAENSQSFFEQPAESRFEFDDRLKSIYVSQSSVSINPMSIKMNIEKKVALDEPNLLKMFLVKPITRKKRKKRNLRLNLSGKISNLQNMPRQEAQLRFKTPNIPANGPTSAGNRFMSVTNPDRGNFFKFTVGASLTSIGPNENLRLAEKMKTPYDFRVPSLCKIDETLGIKQENSFNLGGKDLDASERDDICPKSDVSGFNNVFLPEPCMSINPVKQAFKEFDFQAGFGPKTPILPTITNQICNLDNLPNPNNFFSRPIVPIVRIKKQDRATVTAVKTKLKVENHVFNPLIDNMFRNFDLPFSIDETKIQTLKNIYSELENLGEEGLKNGDSKAQSNCLTRFLCHLKISEKDFKSLNLFQTKTLLMKIFKKTFDLKELMFNWESHSQPRLPRKDLLLGKRSFSQAIKSKPPVQDSSTAPLIFVEEKLEKDDLFGIIDEEILDSETDAVECPDMKQIICRVITFLRHFDSFKSAVCHNEYLRDSYNYSIFKNGPKLKIPSELLSLSLEELIHLKLDFALLQEFLLFKNICYTKNQKLREVYLTHSKQVKKILLRKTDIQNLRFIKRRKEHEFTKYVFRLALKTFRLSKVAQGGKRLNFKQKNQFLKNNFFKLEDLNPEFKDLTPENLRKIEAFLWNFFPTRKGKGSNKNKSQRYLKNNCPNYQIGFFKAFQPFQHFLKSLSLIEESISKISHYTDNFEVSDDLKNPNKERELMKKICNDSGRLPWSLQESLIGIHYLEVIRPAISFAN